MTNQETKQALLEVLPLMKALMAEGKFDERDLKFMLNIADTLKRSTERLLKLLPDKAKPPGTTPGN